MSEKTEAPSEQKLREARSKGQVVKSQEVVSCAQLLFLLMFFNAQLPKLLELLNELFLLCLSQVGQPLHLSLEKVLTGASSLVSEFYFPMAAGLMAITIASSMAQTGLLFVSQALTISADKLNPINNIQHLVSLRTLFELGKSLLKLITLSFIFYYLVQRYLRSLQCLPLCPLEVALPLITQLTYWLWGSLVVCCGLFALADYSFQYYTLMQQLMMTKEEVKQEYKNNEGSPELKSRRREMHEEIQSGSLASKVKKSSVLVRNPTHIAIALYYVRGETPLPQVLAKGWDRKASDMVKLAEKYNVPIVEQVALARALMRDSVVGAYIPKHLFEPVAAILKQIMNIGTHTSSL